MSERDSDDALDAIYRRASAADARGPGADVRARILAEAQAAARRSAPAANQSRYWMGAVAGVAVLGFTLLMLRQVDTRLPGQAETTVSVPALREGVEADAGAAPVTQAESATVREAESATNVANASDATDAIDAAERSTATSASPMDDRALRARSAEREESRKAEGAAQESQAFRAQATPPAQAPAPAGAPPPPPVAPPAPPVAVQQPVPPAPVILGAPVTTAAPASRDAANDEGVELNEVTVTGSRSVRPGEGAVPGPRSPVTVAPRRDEAPARPASATRLLQDHFPQQYASERPHRLWLVRDARSGEVLRLGEFADGTTWDGERARIEATLVNRRIASTRVESLRNARGQVVQLTIAEAR